MTDIETGDYPARGRDYQFHLFISGLTPRSLHAIAVVRRLCEDRLGGCYALEISDVFDNPELARTRQIVAVPALIMDTPVPRRVFVGDMSNAAVLLAGLGLANVD